MTSAVFDARRCMLGEGPLWHPRRKQLFWFDILNNRLMSRRDDQPIGWDFDERVSAAGWIDDDTLLIASETRLMTFGLETGKTTTLTPLEADLSNTRSNDGRADPCGGFWIGTMGKSAQTAAGALYRWYRGTLRQLHAGLTIPNSLCFAPDRSAAYFSDTAKGTVFRQPLDPQTGWPEGPADPWLDLRPEGLNPDGAVTDSDGTLWIAQWGAGRVAGYSAQGRFVSALTVPARHTSCPAFGGDDLQTLFVTSALEDIDADTTRAEPTNGCTFALPAPAKGRPEPQVIL